MSKYYIDTEFIEDFYKPLLGKRRHFIDLISIGIVSGDSREYYGISNEFDLKRAWKDEWLRENVLRSIHEQLCEKEGTFGKTYFAGLFMDFSYKSMKTLIKWHGKPNKQIAKEILEFVNPPSGPNSLNYSSWNKHLNKYGVVASENRPVEFYGYYVDYDWVPFCSLFGGMIDLPKGFPQHCIDLKQTLDDVNEVFVAKRVQLEYGSSAIGGQTIFNIKEHINYPKQENEHNALEDARWNKKLHDFITTL